MILPRMCQCDGLEHDKNCVYFISQQCFTRDQEQLVQAGLAGQEAQERVAVEKETAKVVADFVGMEKRIGLRSPPRKSEAQRAADYAEFRMRVPEADRMAFIAGWLARAEERD